METATGPSRMDRLMVWLMPRISPMNVWIYRKSNGRLGGKTNSGGPVLLLSTTGRRTGELRTVALGYYEDEDHWYVVGSNGGQSTAPAWALNLQQNPSSSVQVGEQVIDTTAELLVEPQRAVAWEGFTKVYPDYLRAQTWTDRTFPLFRLPKTPAVPPGN